MAKTRLELGEEARQSLLSGSSRNRTASKRSSRPDLVYVSPQETAAENLKPRPSESASGRAMQDKRMEELPKPESVERKTSLTLKPKATPAQVKVGIYEPSATPFREATSPERVQARSPLLQANPNQFAALPPKRVNPIQSGYNQLIHGAQSAINFQQQPTTEVPSTGNKTLDKFLRETGSFLPGLASGQTEAEGLGLISKGVQHALGKAAPKIAPIVSRIAGHAAEAGIENARVGAASGQTSGEKVAENLGVGAAFGGGATALGAGVKAGLSALAGKVSATAQNLLKNSLRQYKVVEDVGASEPLGLPSGRVNTKTTGKPVQTPDVITPDYQFKLPFGNEQKAANRAAAAEDLQHIEDEINSINQQYEAKVIDEYHYLKDTMKQGVKQGEIFFDPNDVTGDTVIARTGRQSNNEKWYRDFYAEKGRAPSNKELYDLARQRVENGFVVDEVGNMAPSWTDENQFHETLSALTQVRDQIKKTLQDTEQRDTFPTNANLSTPTAGKGSAIEAPRPSVEAQKPSTTSLIVSEAPPQETPVSESAIPSEQTHTTPNSTPRKRQQGIRSNFETQMRSEALSNETKKEIAKLDHSYNPITNKETVEAADSRIANKGLDQATSDFLSETVKDENYIAEGYRLMQLHGANGRNKLAATIADLVAQALTKGGQTGQAGRIISKLSPEGKLIRLTERARENGMEITDADSGAMRQAAIDFQKSEGGQIRSNSVEDIVDKMKNGEKPTADELQTLSNFLDRAEDVAPARDMDLEAILPTKTAEGVRKRDKVVSFLEKQEQAARDRIAKRRGRLNSLPLDELTDYAILMSTKVAKGLIKASTHVEDIVKELGEEVRPYATKIFNRAQNLVKSTAKRADENFSDLNKTFGRDQDSQEKIAVQAMADHVRSTIEEAKKGELSVESLQKLRDYADEIAEIIEEKPQKEVSSEKKYLQNVKQLAKKISQIESEKGANPQDLKELNSLIRKVADDPTVPKEKRVKMDAETDNALQNIADDVMQRTRKTETKPTTIQEKVLAQFAKKFENASTEDLEKLRTLAKDMAKMEGKTAKQADFEMQKIMNKYDKASLTDRMNAVRFIAMLGNTHTQEVNLGSSLGQAAYNNALDFLGHAMEKMLQSVLKKKGYDTRVTHAIGMNPLRFMTEYGKNFVEGAKANWQGVTPGGLQHVDEMSSLAFKSKWNPIGLAERAVRASQGGADYGVYQTQFKNELIKQARLAYEKEMKGIPKGERKDQAKYIRDFLAAPNATALDLADASAREATMQQKHGAGSQVANAINSLNNKKGPGGGMAKVAHFGIKAALPFVRTPLNIAEVGANMTPLGILRGANQLRKATTPQEQRRAIQTLGLGLTGSVVLSGLGYELSKLGIITDSNDTGNASANAINEQSGKGAYRFNSSAFNRALKAVMLDRDWNKVKEVSKYQKGDTTFNYNKVQPLAFPVALGAGLQKGQEKGGIVGGLANAGKQGFNSLLDMSAVKGLQDVLKPEQSGSEGDKQTGVLSNFAESFFKSFSPSGLAQEARREDKYQRQAPYNQGIIKDTLGYFQSRNPWGFGIGVPTSEDLPKKITTLGEPKTYARGKAANVTGNYLNPLQFQKQQYNEAAQVISDLMERTNDVSFAPSAPVKKFTATNKATKQSETVKIDPKKYEELQQKVGQEIATRIMKINPNLTDAKKIDKIKTITSDTKKKYLNKLKKEMGYSASK